MGVRISGGVGPVRASIPLDGCLTALGLTIMYLVIACAWLVWAVIALTVAGVAKLARKHELSRRTLRTLKWSLPGKKNVYRANLELEDGSTWKCHHKHQTEGAARECAMKEDRRRARGTST